MEVLDLRDDGRRWRGGGEMFLAKGQGAEAIGTVLVEERVAFFVELMAGE